MAKARGLSLGLQSKRRDRRSELVAESDAPDVFSEPAGELECRAEAGPNAITDAGGARDPAETGDAAEFRMEVFATQQPVLRNAELGAGADNPTGRVPAKRVVRNGWIERIDVVGGVSQMGGRSAGADVGKPHSHVGSDTPDCGEE